MKREIYGEWRRLEEEASAILRDAPKRDGFSPECHAVILPAFEDACSYTILAAAPNSSAPMLGLKRVWKRNLDLAKLEGPVLRLRYGPTLRPTIEERQADVPRQFVESVLERAADLKVPSRVRAETVGADGANYVLCFGRLFTSTRFEWWSSRPNGWEPLGTLLSEITEGVDRGLTKA